MGGRDRKVRKKTAQISLSLVNRANNTNSCTGGDDGGSKISIMKRVVSHR